MTYMQIDKDTYVRIPIHPPKNKHKVIYSVDGISKNTP